MNRNIINPANNARTQRPVVRDLERARRMGITPSDQLRRHFVSLARRVKLWSNDTVGPVSIGVTSVDRRVGRSTVAFNLAAALTKVANDPVLFVEADFGKHFISRRLGKAGGPGLSEIIQSGIEPHQCILPTPLGDLAVLGSGSMNERDSMEWPMDGIRLMIQEKFNEFRYLVFDLAVADDLTSCFSIAPNLDGTILVVDAAQIDHRQINRARKRLEDFGVEIIGLIINKA